MTRFRVQIKVYASANLSEDRLLNPRQLSPKHFDIEAKVYDYLISLIPVHLTEPIQVSLR